MIDYEVPFLGLLLELFVVVSSASARVLDVILKAIDMNHFVKHCCDYVLDRAVYRSCANIKLTAVCIAALPDLIYGNMSVSFRGALYRDDGF